MSLVRFVCPPGYVIVGVHFTHASRFVAVCEPLVALHDLDTGTTSWNNDADSQVSRITCPPHALPGRDYLGVTPYNDYTCGLWQPDTSLPRLPRAAWPCKCTGETSTATASNETCWI